MARLPLNKPPMYCTANTLEESAWCRLTVCCVDRGLGPHGFAIEINPFPFVTHNFPPIIFTLDGYHPTGIKPLEELRPGEETSNTAIQLLSTLATYNVFSSSLSVTPLVVEPLGALG